jgi:putative ABC transport system permease protein
MQALIQDFRFTLRRVRRNPKLALFVVLTLAAGLGLNTVVFSFVDSLLLTRLPFRNPERIYAIEQPSDVGLGFISRNDFKSGAASLLSTDSVAIYRTEGVTLSGVESSRHILATIASDRIFDVLGIQPMIGRLFQKDEDAVGNDFVTVINYGLWKDFFAGDPNVIDRSILVNGTSLRIIGVLPSGISYPSDSALWLPAVFDSKILNSSGGVAIQAIARLRPNVSISQAQAELRHYSKANVPSEAARFVPLGAELTATIRPSLLMLTAAVVLVLLIACANVASLLLARAIDDRREFVIRAALGASPRRLMQQQIVFGVSLAMAAGILGCLFSVWGLRLVYAVRPAALDSLTMPVLDWKVLLYAALLSLGSGILCCALPAGLARRQQASAVLKTSGPQITDRYARVRQALVVLEIACAFTLVIGASLLIRSVQKLSQVPLGYKTANTLTFSISLQGDMYKANMATQTFYQDVLARLRAIPEVVSAGATNYLPLGKTMEMGLPAIPDGDLSKQSMGLLRVVSPEYFRSLGIWLVAGRDFSDADSIHNERVIIINEMLAKKLWPHVDSIVGRHITFSATATAQQAYKVIGIVASDKHGGARFGTAPEFFLSIEQKAWPSMTMVIHTQRDPVSLIPTVRNAVASVDKDQPMFDIKTMDMRVRSSESMERFLRAILVVFGGLSFLLATSGVYGIISYTVARRTREIGIRMALGAEPNQILRNIVRQAVLLCLIALVVGIAAAFLLTRFLSGELFEVSARDPVTFTCVTIVFLLATTAASLQLGRKASQIDPAIAIRYE